MNYETVIPECPNCQTPLNQIKGKYGMFWGCKNYLECGFKGYPVKAERPKEKPDVIRETSTKDQILIETLDAINTRLDTIEKGFADKMANLKKILVLIDSKIK